MNFPEIYSATGMMELIQKIGFLPLLRPSENLDFLLFITVLRAYKAL